MPKRQSKPKVERAVTKAADVGLREWAAPGVIIAIVSLGVVLGQCQLSTIDSRLTGIDSRLAQVDERLTGVDEKIDRRAESIEQRVAETNKRIDSGLGTQSEMSVKVNKTESDVLYLRERIDKIADKLQVSSAEPLNEAPVAWSDELRKDPIGSLKRAGFEVVPLKDFNKDWNVTLGDKGPYVFAPTVQTAPPAATTNGNAE